jgi:hypothetical protein
MERYIHFENIRRYRKLLEQETDEDKRNLIRKLLAEEEAKDIPKRTIDGQPGPHAKA